MNETPELNQLRDELRREIREVFDGLVERINENMLRFEALRILLEANGLPNEHFKQSLSQVRERWNASMATHYREWLEQEEVALRERLLQRLAEYKGTQQ